MPDLSFLLDPSLRKAMQSRQVQDVIIPPNKDVEPKDYSHSIPQEFIDAENQGPLLDDRHTPSLLEKLGPEWDFQRPEPLQLQHPVIRGPEDLPPLNMPHRGSLLI